MSPWLTLVGIGEDGLVGLSPAVRALIDGADVLAGGQRHLAMVPDFAGERLEWTAPFSDSIAALKKLKGRRVTVLASGEPMWFGVGATLARDFDPADMCVVPHPGAFSLAAARLAWRMQETETLSAHGRPVENIVPFLYPGAKLLLLCEDGKTPSKVAALLRQKGFGPSLLTALTHLGGDKESRLGGTAAAWDVDATADLVTLAVECRADSNALGLSRAPGLPDSVFENDGQLTKREARAVTLSALAPYPGARLLDVGAGCGSISIEWMRAARDAEAVAIERDPARAQRIARNALALGVPRLDVRIAPAPTAFVDLPANFDAAFVGGAVAAHGVIEGAFAALRPGGRLVANAVTADGEARLINWQAEHGGLLSRIAISRLGEGGVWRSLAPVTQYQGVKP